MKKLIITGLLCGASAWATTPVPFSSHEFATTSTGVLATLEFDSDANRLYSVFRNENLLSNEWNAVTSDLPGTGSPIVQYDLTPLAMLHRFYKASSIAAPPANLLLNGDFETGTPTSGGTATFDAPPWQRYVNLENYNSWLTDDTFDPIIGTDNQALEFRWGVTTIYQDFTAIADRNYLFSCDSLQSSGNTKHIPTMQVEWYDAASTVIGSTINLDSIAPAGTGTNVGVWISMQGQAIAPAGAVAGRLVLTLKTESTGTRKNCYFDNAYVGLVPLGAAVVSTDWTSFGNASLAAAAQYAGLYAVANDTIEINRIDESIVDTVSVGAINGLAFTASGRQLFISTPDSVKAYNVGTGQLRNFIDGLSLGTEKTGIAHFKGELFVGTASGDILRYDAKLDAAAGTYSNTIHIGEPVCGMAVDIQDEMLYIASPSNLYSFNPSNSVLTQIATASNLVDITFGRTYGANGHGGLILLQDHGNERVLSLVSTAALQAGGSVVPEPYLETRNAIPSISATACGRILAAGTTPQILSDASDTRMDFMEWVADEFQQNVLLVKALCWQDGGLTGMVHNSAARLGGNRRTSASPDAAYWVVCQLLMSDEINGDPEAQGIVREIVKRYATLKVSTDGHWYHWYNPNTGLSNDIKTSIYSTMKGVHLAIRAKAYYPNDPEIVAAANTIIGRLRNQRDYIREFGKLASPADDLGPLIDANTAAPYQEIHLASELMAATEPMAENAYLDYWRYRENHTINYTLPDEPIVRNNTRGFWRMYDQSTIQFCRDDPEWTQEFRNFYALFAGWTDDHAPEHLTAFSAGSTPSGYSGDNYTYHPGTVNSFGTVIGFGLQGDTVPVVGAYFAYRNGRRQAMQGSSNYAGANLLTRISYDDPSWLMYSISPTDHQYAGYALGEILAPGSIDRAIALHTYLEPQFDGTTLRFSRTVKRHVRGTTDGTNWDSLGFHDSPYTPPAGLAYTNYMVTGAEGELLDPVSNQTYDVSADFDSTLYIVRAVSTHTTNLRVRWFNGGSFISEQTNSTLRVDAIKPAGATTMRVDLSGETFDQISVVLDGKLETFSNAGFELGNLTDWTKYTQTGITAANAADSRLEGSRALELKATAGTVNGKYGQVYHEYDISADPTNTHYVLEFDVLTENLEGSSLRCFTQVYSSSNTVLRTEYFDTYEHANSQTMLSAGFRKRDADHTKFRFYIRLRHDDASAVTADERVLVDHLRLLKMKP